VLRRRRFRDLLHYRVKRLFGVVRFVLAGGLPKLVDLLLIVSQDRSSPDDLVVES
jgi:hypothetical protein